VSLTTNGDRNSFQRPVVSNLKQLSDVIREHYLSATRQAKHVFMALNNLNHLDDLSNR
jgi:hypothetical protein